MTNEPCRVLARRAISATMPIRSGARLCANIHRLRLPVLKLPHRVGIDWLPNVQWPEIDNRAPSGPL
jgi:hypothetical protein